MKSIRQLVEDRHALEKKVEKLENKLLGLTKDQLLQQAAMINGYQFVGAVVDVSSADALKKLCFELKPALKDYVVVLAANIDGKANVAVMVDDAVVAARQLEAPAIIKQHIAPLIKGGGGGQKTLATAGGQDPSNLPQVIEKVKSLL